AEGLALMETSPFDYVLCDVRMPGMDGMTFLRSARERFPQTTFIMMSAYGNLDSAVAAMKEGAYDYVSKPFKSDEILLTLKKADERERLKAENLRLQNRVKRLEAERTCGDILGDSQPMKRVFELVRRVADHKTTVLITGESGTGKELVAKAVHSAGPRASGPMVSINCGGIPESLLESELFGYRRGAFTNAVRDKPGLFHEADGGTIFLDEIGELPFSLQVKLLRVLQEGEITPLGSTAATRIDVRVIAATARDLRKEVNEGRFREDLFYRIHVMPIHLPPLRERRGDIPLLVGHFLERFNRKLEREVEGLTPEATAALVRYDWPGNVRELENVLERAVLLAGDRWITPTDLPDGIASGRDQRPSALPEESLSIKRATRRLESELIRRALEITGGNRSKASRILEISRPVLLSKIRDYGLE
ncbi:MAG: sigma-54-dependent transcriptional regulator, partial [Desulfobacteraceae bacterium]